MSGTWKELSSQEEKHLFANASLEMYCLTDHSCLKLYPWEINTRTIRQNSFNLPGFMNMHGSLYASLFSSCT